MDFQDSAATLGHSQLLDDMSCDGAVTDNCEGPSVPHNNCGDADDDMGAVATFLPFLEDDSRGSDASISHDTSLQFGLLYSSHRVSMLKDNSEAQRVGALYPEEGMVMQPGTQVEQNPWYPWTDKIVS
jgi:hypothetical protein